MSVIMYERVGFEGRRPSPFSWRIRYALAHKGIEVEYRPTRFADVDIIEKLSGQHFVPIIVNGPKVVHDSWHIAAYLDQRFSHKPTLLGDDAGRNLNHFVNHWSDTVLSPTVPASHLSRLHLVPCSGASRLFSEIKREDVGPDARGSGRGSAKMAS